MPGAHVEHIPEHTWGPGLTVGPGAKLKTDSSQTPTALFKLNFCLLMKHNIKEIVSKDNASPQASTECTESQVLGLAAPLETESVVPS